MSCGSPHDSDCRDVLERVYAYLDGELTAADVERIRVHLQECAPCLAEHDLDRMLKELLRRSCRCETAPQELRQRILVRITEVRVTATGPLEA